jgi:accessory gene regulator protein AgrB
MTPQSQLPDPARAAEIRRRQRSRAIIMGLLLAAFAILIYGITIVRMTGK